MARVETIDGSNRGLVYGQSIMIVVGNSKDTGRGPRGRSDRAGRIQQRGEVDGDSLCVVEAVRLRD